jgi:glutamine synthetase
MLDRPGIRRMAHPGDPMDKNLYDLPPEELKDIPTIASGAPKGVPSWKHLGR